jgi:hypothetical protein
MTPLTLSVALSLLLCGSHAATKQRASRSLVPSETYPAIAGLSPKNIRVTYRTYTNARYGYSIAYPVGLLVPQGEADNGDGQKFLSKDGRAMMLVFGSNRLERSLEDEYRSAQAGEGNRNVTYKVLKKDMFVVSGTENGKIFYQKTLLRGDVFKTFIIEYDESQRTTFDSITSRVARSFVG